METPSKESAAKAIRFAVSAMVSPRETLDIYSEIINYVEGKLGRPVEIILRKGYL